MLFVDILRHWRVVHRLGIFPHPGFLIFSLILFFPFTRFPKYFHFFRFFDKSFVCISLHFQSYAYYNFRLSQVRGPVRHNFTVRVSPPPDHHTLLDGLDFVATVGIKVRPLDNKFTWRVISLLQNTQTSAGRPDLAPSCCNTFPAQD